MLVPEALNADPRFVTELKNTQLQSQYTDPSQEASRKDI